MAKSTRRKLRGRERSAYNSKEEMAFVDVVSGLMLPIAFDVLITARERFWQNPIVWRVLICSKNKLDKSKWKRVASCESDPRGCHSSLAKIWTYVELVEDSCSFQTLTSPLYSKMICCT
jgi:hypothetical protein